MKDLLEQNFLQHYNIGRFITVQQEGTSEEWFDLHNAKDTPMIVAYQQGTGSFHNTANATLSVIDFDRFITNIKGKIFEKRKRCDFLLHDDDNKILVLNEHTTGNNLAKPIYNKRTETIEYPGGKYEKAEHQLFDSLSLLSAVPAIKEKIANYKQRICLMSYKTTLRQNAALTHATLAFGRYRQTEANATKDHGAILSCPAIESHNFEYRRISHEYTFKL